MDFEQIIKNQKKKNIYSPKIASGGMKIVPEMDALQEDDPELPLTQINQIQNRD
jgi:hypothetical protein